MMAMPLIAWTITKWEYVNLLEWAALYLYICSVQYNILGAARLTLWGTFTLYISIVSSKLYFFKFF